jgi:pyruvate dehydrogenase E2 component (dihydrolipoamide acetyltransferase)
MATKIVMPKLSAKMDEALVVTWHKNEGDEVKEGEAVLEVMFEKVQYEIPAPASGVLAKIIAQEGADVPAGELLGVITAAGEAFDEADLSAEAPAGEAVAAAAPAAAVRAAPPREAGRVKASPAAKRLAKEKGIALESITGTGPGGRIVLEDVQRALEGGVPEEVPTAPPGEVRVKERIPLTGLRKIIHDRMMESWKGNPRVTQVVEVDMTEAVAFRKYNLPRWEKADGVRVTFNDMIVKAAALALREFPIVNSHLEGNEIVVYEDINVGMAVATDDGLVAPVIRSADRKSLAQISRESRSLSEKAKTKALAPEDFADHTFTVTNLGGLGIEVFTPIINPPDSAILGVGRIAERPAVVNGEVTVRSIMYISLVFNHQVVDGAPAAQFEQRVKAILEDPQQLLG